MASEGVIMALVKRLMRSYRSQDTATMDSYVEDWLQVFFDVSDAELVAAVQVWQRNTEEPWFPTPGKLLGIVRKGRDVVRDRSPSGDTALVRLATVSGVGVNWPPAMGSEADAPAPRVGRPDQRHSGTWFTAAEVSRPGFWNPLRVLVERDGERVREWREQRYTDPPVWRLSHDPAERHALEAALKAAGGWSAWATRGVEQDSGERRHMREVYEQTVEREVRIEQDALLLAVQRLQFAADGGPRQLTAAPAPVPDPEERHDYSAQIAAAVGRFGGRR